ncbi:lantibiotic dehydratase [Streptomyces albidochromogenes]|uniref:lantibiotic dehydratase n=1 Tax=Streptomyces albidochromogenes TaxID=329524 RepID=UPI00110FF7D6|nr:lantibiotic dehydratase [Streptomyces albidochromogenes]
MAWLGAVWADATVNESLSHASPSLAAQVQALFDAETPRPRDVRRAMLSVARYLLRAQSRATPFGHFAGVTTARLSEQARSEWGARDHTKVSVSAEWLTAIVTQLESHSELLERLPVVANSTLATRGDRLIVPYQADAEGRRTRAVEASLLLTDPVRAVLAVTRAPVPAGSVGAKLRAEFPAAGPEKVTKLIRNLVGLRALITSLHVPSTETDPLGQLLSRLDAVDAQNVTAVARLVRELHAIHRALADCSTPAVEQGRIRRASVAARLRDVVPGLRRHPLAIDVRLDAALALPPAVAREIEGAALVLTRVSTAPYGTAAWKAYHQRFYERFGIGSMVPVQDVVADSGIGYPDSYPGTASRERRPRLSSRDEALLRLAQRTVLEGRDEVVLDENVVASLELGPERVRVPPHLEVGVRVHAQSVEHLQRGDFQLEVVSVSRGAGVSTGRFLSVLDPPERASFVSELAELPGADSNTVAAQLSFPPLLPESAHIARSPRVLPTVISLEEHREPSDDVLTVEDLAVGCDGRRMYLAVPARGYRIDPVGMHALNLRTHTPPLVRFLTELVRAQCAQVTTFDWGAAATMPFLPRLRYGRTVLSPARWRLEAEELPGPAQPWQEWDDAFNAWRFGRRLPREVHLAEGDRLLACDLAHVGHRVLLREHVNRSGLALLTEASSEFGWCAGRAHEVVVPLKAVAPSPWPRLPAPTTARVIGHDQVQAPGTSSVLLSSLYGDIRRQDTILSGHLPDLLGRLGQPAWWFIRFRDPGQHLRVRIALPGPEAFAEMAATVSTWGDELRRAGLLAELRYPTSYPEMGRWGSESAWSAAEEVFRADSRAVLAQLSRPHRPHRRVLVAAHTVAIATAFLGSTEAGMRWLINHIPPNAPSPVPRPLFTAAVRLSDPRDDWTALRSAPGGDAIVQAWAERDQALATYRCHFPGTDTQGIAIDDVLTSLLHCHFVRAVAVDFPEEAICLYLARAAALAWTARSTRRPM